jgi:precorrin-6B methylase 2
MLTKAVVDLIFQLVLLGVATGITIIIFRLAFAEVPTVPTSGKVVDEIIAALKLSDGSVLYDLGCGDARMLIAAHNKFPTATFVGVEYYRVPYLLAKLRLALTKKTSHISIQREDLFEADIKNANRIFVYLIPKVMDKLLPKLEREAQPGTRIVSLDFRFSKREPNQVIELQGRQKNKISKRLFIYEF